LSIHEQKATKKIINRIY